ncbi:MAG: (2Fe-2S) ferredoxin domain-containing protein [Oscillospiraceae bacterium]|nr:(2Fe-2S) ferredoxin domain-containing protein [Oscillospiraceae bacterium]
MKNIAELNAYKEKAKNKFAVKENGGMKIIVGMATCGIAAGAAPVLEILNEEIKSKKLENVSVAQAGCIGLCQYEPIVEVFESGKEKITYVKIDAKKAKEIVNSHIIGGRIVSNYTIGEAIKNL